MPDLAWDGTDVSGTPVPAGRYRLVAKTSEQQGPCGERRTNGDGAARVEASLGILVVP